MDGAFAQAFLLIVGFDAEFLGIVGLSLWVTLSAVAISAVIGLPLGALLAVCRFPGRGALIVAVNALMGLPPVVAGLLVYLALSRSGPAGFLGILFTPSAMIVAQTILVLPIVIALTRQVADDMWAEYGDHLTSLGQTGRAAVGTLLYDGRFALAITLLAGFGRAAAEVGAVMIVGGNIAGYTRTMTTAIALETSKGDLALALGLGIVLLALTLTINVVVFGASRIWHHNVR
jgi:tungstate transport system permease protein